MPNSRDLPVKWSRNLTIYEVNLRQYTASGTFREFATHLPRLQKLGVGILWFMPIQPAGIEKRKGTRGSYYCISDYMSVDPAYGTLGEFKELVSAIHQMGMHVILDWVAIHTSWDHQLTKTNPEFYKLDDKGAFKPPVTDWSDVIHLNYDNPAVAQYMIKAMQFWLHETDIDGFRCDMANLVPLSFWQNARMELERIKPIFMLAEAEQRELLSGAFDAIYNWRLFHTFNRIASGENSSWDLYSMLNYEIYAFPSSAYQMLFISNHDENSWNGSELERLGQGLEAFAVLYFTLTGIPMIYSGQEAGLSKRLLFFDKDEIEWKEDKMFPLYQKLISLKKRNRALWSGPYGGVLRRIETRNSGNVFAFMREVAGNKVIVMLNLSKHEQFAHLSVDNLPGYYKDIFADTQVELFDNHYFVLKPWEYRVFEFFTA